MTDDDNKDEELEERLDLDDDADRLPWLESAEDYDGDTVSPTRVVWLLFMGLVAIGVVVGLVYLYQQRQQQLAVSGQGGLIEAPEGDYKVAPEDAEGKTFDGTGDASPAAAEGQERVAALGGDDKKAANGVLVQLGAYSSEAKANSGWVTLSGRYDYIKALPKRIASAQVEGTTVYRLSAVAPDAATAQSVCNKLKTAGQSCLVVR
ncbi:MAG: SPOR domain-containing protein [Pseudomonadota bacterium]